VKLSTLISKLITGLMLVNAAWLSSCVNPQQVELLEREQRRLRGDMNTLHTDVDGFRATLADTRANIQQMQRELSAIKERIDETRVQVGRQLGQTNRDGDQRVKNLESRLAKLEEDAKAQAEALKNREEELKQVRETMALPISPWRSRRAFGGISRALGACSRIKITKPPLSASKIFSKKIPRVSWLRAHNIGSAKAILLCANSTKQSLNMTRCGDAIHRVKRFRPRSYGKVPPLPN
jgi:outer membrane murein-binding lipoprotein Lpp